MWVIIGKSKIHNIVKGQKGDSNPSFRGRITRFLQSLKIKNKATILFLLKIIHTIMREDKNCCGL